MAQSVAAAGMVGDFMRGQLMDRRHKLEHAVRAARQPSLFARLLNEVDAALARFEDGTFGICETCHDTIEADRLIADPLVRFCLDHLDASQRTALEQDLELAARIQRGLLPKPDNVYSGWCVSYHYEPAGVVSGDYCDVVDAGDRGLYFMLGDVSGKGVAASMLMAHLHAMFRALIPVGLPLKTMVEQASRVFCESTLPTHYATLVCGRARPDGDVEICNAGHPPPLLLRGSGDVAALEGSGLPLGVFCAEEFPVRALRLEPGNAIVLYSDGISEATDTAGVEYGAERLRQLALCGCLMNPPALVAACRDDLAAFRRGAPKLDDMTMLVVGRTV